MATLCMLLVSTWKKLKISCTLILMQLPDSFMRITALLISGNVISRVAERIQKMKFLVNEVMK